jgi:rhodanese-related sulfurtransferase
MKMMMIVALFISLFALTNCGGTGTAPAAGAISEISVQDTWKAVEGGKEQFIDVRTADEFAAGHAKGVRHMPLDGLEQEMAKLDKEKPVYIICQTGNRSRKAAAQMERAGFKKLYNVTGGTSAWMAAKLPAGE